MFCSYSVDPVDTGLELGCVVRVQSGQLGRHELEVVRVSQLDVDRSLLVADNEQLVSNVIAVRTATDVTV